MGTIFVDENDGFNVRYHGNQKLNTAVPQSIKYEVEQFMAQNCSERTDKKELEKYVKQVLDFYIEHEFITVGRYTVSYMESTWDDIYKDTYSRMRAKVARTLLSLGLISEHEGPTTALDRILGLVSVYEVVPNVPVPSYLVSDQSDKTELEVLDNVLEIRSILPVPCRTTICKISIKFNGCPTVNILCRACFTDPSV